MSKHGEALKRFIELRKYCEERKCTDCIFYKTFTIDNEDYEECVVDGIKVVKNVFDREVLPFVERNIAKLERQEKQ